VETPVCRHFGVCGGCDWQDLSYRQQLERKHQRLTSLLAASVGSRLPPVAPVIGMQPDGTGWPWGFRHKAAFVFSDVAGNAAALGHYRANSREIVRVSECPVHAPRANDVAFALAGHLARAHVPAAGPSLRGILRHVIVRTTRDSREVVAMLVVTRNDKVLRPPIRAFLATEDAPDGFYLNIHDKPGPFMIGRETTRLAGRSHVRESVGGASFLVSPTAFFQTNVEAAEALVALVVGAVPDGSASRGAEPRTPLHVLDLYGGSGLFTVPLARRGHHVTLVEENRQAVHDAEANLRLNRIVAGVVRTIAARVEDTLQRLRRERADVVVLDPPRQGTPPEVLQQVFERIRPPKAVYVSCNPEALAAELPAILDSGYDAVNVQPVDMFPHTTHIETVVELDARRTPRSRSSSGTRPVSGTRRSRPAG
jgi:23S rRNA (uracil1939-C5)-methyltransferase